MIEWRRSGSAEGTRFENGCWRGSKNGGEGRGKKKMEREMSEVCALPGFRWKVLQTDIRFSDVNLDPQARPHITRKLRNQLGGSPPHSPLTTTPNGTAPGPVTVGPLVNPHSLSIDELPSPFPLPLTSTQLPYGNSGATTGGNGRRRNKGGGFQAQIAGGLGKSGGGLSSAKDFEIDADLGEIRRGNKRRRAAAAAVKV